MHEPHLSAGVELTQPCPALCILGGGTVVAKAQNSISLSLSGHSHPFCLADMRVIWQSGDSERAREGGCDEALPPPAAKEPLRPFFAISAFYLSQTEPLENSMKAMRNLPFNLSLSLSSVSRRIDKVPQMPWRLPCILSRKLTFRPLQC